METKLSQEKMILAYMAKGYGITSLEALDMFGCFRLQSRIADLRRKGHLIKTDMIPTATGKKVARYSLENAEEYHVDNIAEDQIKQAKSRLTFRCRGIQYTIDASQIKKIKVSSYYSIGTFMMVVTFSDFTELIFKNLNVKKLTSLRDKIQKAWDEAKEGGEKC